MGNPLVISIYTKDSKTTGLYIHWGAESRQIVKELTNYYKKLLTGAKTQKEVVDRILTDDETIGMCLHETWYCTTVIDDLKVDEHGHRKCHEEMKTAEYQEVCNLSKTNNWRTGQSKRAGIIAISETAYDNFMAEACDNSAIDLTGTILQLI